MEDSRSVIIAPDSFKGSMTAREVAEAIASGWRHVRPNDRITLIPQADGGEGTLDAIESSTTEAVRHSAGPVTGPDGRATIGEWLELPERVGVVELAQCCGISLMDALDARGATTRGLGEVIRHALDHGVESLVIALGGSASTDGGAGALQALGLTLLDSTGNSIADGGAALRKLARVSRSELCGPPVKGVTLLADVTIPLLGPDGAAHTFGAQKGATPHDVDVLEAGLRRYASILGGSPDQPGNGAAGGTAFGFATVWNARVSSGAREIQRITGLTSAMTRADVLVTGEGSLDASSFAGKTVGEALILAKTNAVPSLVIAGQVHGSSRAPLAELRGSGTDYDPRVCRRQYSLSDHAESMADAHHSAFRLLAEAGSEAARHYAIDGDAAATR